MRAWMATLVVLFAARSASAEPPRSLGWRALSFPSAPWASPGRGAESLDALALEHATIALRSLDVNVVREASGEKSDLIVAVDCSAAGGRRPARRISCTIELYDGQGRVIASHAVRQLRAADRVSFARGIALLLVEALAPILRRTVADPALRDGTPPPPGAPPPGAPPPPVPAVTTGVPVGEGGARNDEPPGKPTTPARTAAAPSAAPASTATAAHVTTGSRRGLWVDGGPVLVAGFQGEPLRYGGSLRVCGRHRGLLAGAALAAAGTATDANRTSLSLARVDLAAFIGFGLRTRGIDLAVGGGPALLLYVYDASGIGARADGALTIDVALGVRLRGGWSLGAGAQGAAALSEIHFAERAGEPTAIALGRFTVSARLWVGYRR